MTRAWAIRLLAAAAAIGLTVTVATADESSTSLSARLSGFNEVAATGPILTAGTASFHATVTGNTLTYTLTFSGLTTTATQAHLHFGQRGVNGGIFLFLCNTSNPAAPPGTPACTPGKPIMRTVTAADIVGGAASQNLSAGDFTGALRVIRAGDAYANVHSTKFPGGEIRGQVQFGDG